jgi:alcohol dehydrogenase
MPPALTAATGMDALTHAIEAYTAMASEPLADAAALYAVELIILHLKNAVADGQNLAARSGMMLGSVLAAIAFSHSDVAAVHCIAEALGGKYDLPHGVCNAIVLPVVMDYNLDFCTEKYARLARAMGFSYRSIQSGAQKAVASVKKLAADIKLPSFRELGINEDDFRDLARKSAANGSNASNPRPMEEADYMQIFRTLNGMSVPSTKAKKLS